MSASGRFSLTRGALGLGVAALLGLPGCDEPSSSAQPPSRVVAIASKSQDDDARSLCDVARSPDSAPSFVYPALDGPAPLQLDRPLWINVWATWCPPCIDELPLLRKVEAELKAEGRDVSLVLLSVDSSRAVIDKFQAAHREVTGSLRVADATQLEVWLTSIGMDKGATLPLHVLVDRGGKVLCGRTGALRDSDVPALKKLLTK